MEQPSSEVKRVLIGEGVDEDDLLRWLPELEKMQASAGWQLYMEMVMQLRQVFAFAGYKDRNHKPAYYEGMIDAPEVYVTALDGLIEKAQALRDERTRVVEEKKEPNPRDFGLFTDQQEVEGELI